MRYIKNIFYALLIWLCMPLIVNIPSFLVSGVLFPALCQWFPHTFTYYSPVTEPNEYALMTAILELLIATLAIVIFSYLTVRYDNERMEYMITKTEGMYTRREGASLYYPRYVRSDVIVSFVIPIPFVVGMLFVPEEIPEIISPVLDYLFGFVSIFTDHLGYLFGTVTVCLLVLITRLASGYVSLGAWQGIWLSETN